jgi:putative tricarboxylic transport membrane protein
MLTRRYALAAAALLACAGASPAAAEFKPTRPIEVVVHGGPGSGNDLFGRAVVAAVEQEKLATVRFQIANKPGGGSTTAANYMMSKDGDAHTIGVFTNIWLTDPLVQAEAKARLHDMTPTPGFSSSRHLSWSGAIRNSRPCATSSTLRKRSPDR